MVDTSTLIKLSLAVFSLVDNAQNEQELSLLADLALEVKQVLDYNNIHFNEIHPDLGLELLEYAQIKLAKVQDNIEIWKVGYDPVKYERKILIDLLNDIQDEKQK